MRQLVTDDQMEGIVQDLTAHQRKIRDTVESELRAAREAMELMSAPRTGGEPLIADFAKIEVNSSGVWLTLREAGDKARGVQMTLNVPIPALVSLIKACVEAGKLPREAVPSLSDYSK